LETLSILKRRKILNIERKEKDSGNPVIQIYTEKRRNRRKRKTVKENLVVNLGNPVSL